MIGSKNIVIIIVLFFIAIAGWYVFGPDLSSDRSGIDEARTNIQSASEQQSKAAERIKSVETGLDDSAAKAGRISTGLAGTAAAIANVETRIDSGQNGAQSSAELIAEGQSILARIRKRNQF